MDREAYGVVRVGHDLDTKPPPTVLLPAANNPAKIPEGGAARISQNGPREGLLRGGIPLRKAGFFSPDKK